MHTLLTYDDVREEHSIDIPTHNTNNQQAYAAGCPFLLKPSELTPLTSLYFAHITKDILPEGVFTVLPSDDHDLVRDALLSSEVRKFSFTGSTETVRFYNTFERTLSDVLHS